MKFRQITLILLFGLCSCSSDQPLTKQQQLYRSIAAIEDAFEERKLSRITEYISDSYQDESGRKIPEIKRAIQMQLMRHKSLYVFSTIKNVVWENENKAHVNIIAAMAGKPIENASILTSLRADMINFNVDFIRVDDRFHVQSAQWKWASPAEFLLD